MAVVGIGTDVVRVERVARAIGHPERGGRFLARVFTEGERRDCEARGRAAEGFAARFAAKEAVMKALGASGPWGFAWGEIEVVRVASGAPQVRLSGGAAERARRLGVGRLHVSISHERDVAIAFALAETVG